MRTIAAFGLAALAVAGATLVVKAYAADLDYPPPPVFNEPDTPQEFGAGWYLRGDASFGSEDQPKLSVTGFNTKKTGWGWAAGGGIGYAFNSFVRADITGDYFDPITYASNVAVPTYEIINKASLQRYDGMVNAYVDLGSWYGLTPYIGAGVGIGVFNPSVKVTADPTLIAIGAPNSQTNFAWAAMAGVSYKVDPHIALDLGYRHLDLGHFSTTLAGYAIDKRMTQEEIRLGVRYTID